jgi:DNA-directed RNA polymerase subunit RPC12/RpoP
MNCGICGASSTGGQYCVGCGEPLGSTLTASRTAIGTRERARPAPGTWLALQEIRLVACPKCGAPNSAARWRCARCGQGFDERDNNDSILGETTSSTEEVAAQPESARWLVLITAAAGVAVLAVAIMMLAARGIGPFRAEEQATALAEAIPLAVAEVEASDTGAEGGSIRNLLDGDETTAWLVAGTGRGEWVELRFGQPVQIDYLLVSNGDQRNDASFAAASRVKDLLIEFPNARKVYRVGLPDRSDSVRVTTQGRPPVTDMIRLKILDVHQGQSGITALSEIEALSHRGPAPE